MTCDILQLSFKKYNAKAVPSSWTGEIKEELSWRIDENQKDIQELSKSLKKIEDYELVALLE